MLHLIFQSPVEAAVLARIDSGDVVVFLENAVLRVLQNGSLSARLTQMLGCNRLCVLSTDIGVRGIVQADLIKGFEVIDYAGLVELTVASRVIQSWT